MNRCGEVCGRADKPEVMGLLADLYAEVAELFPGRYLHGGCDEVTWGASEFSKKLLAEESPTDIWARHVNGLNRMARDHDKEFVIWADMAAKQHPECLDGLDRDIVLHDWIYKEHEPEQRPMTISVTRLV